MKSWYLSSTALRSPEGPASGATSTPVPDAGPDADADTNADLNGIRELLDFDPFTPPSEPDKTGQEGEAKKTAPAPAPAGKETKKVGDDKVPPSDADSTPPKPDPVSQQLQEVATLLRQQTEAQTRPKADAEKTPKGPKFNLLIPDSITKALFTSEEPAERAAAFTEYSNGLANLVYNETMIEVRANLAEMVRRIPEISRNQVNELTTQQEMQRDFWDSVAGATVPEAQRLPRTTEMGQFVALTAQNLAKELKAKGQEPAWTPEFRNEIVKRVYTALGRQAPGQAQPQQQQKPNGQQQIQREPKPASFQTGAGQRGGDQVQFKTDLEKEIEETFS